jgi:hypothetical protein
MGSNQIAMLGFMPTTEIQQDTYTRLGGGELNPI